MLEIYLILILTALSTSILGVFLVLQKKAMTTDAISHTILLGIVIGYMFTQDVSSPLLIIFATLIGIITVYLIQILSQTDMFKNDAAIGVVFTALFSIAIIIISMRFDNVHLDIDAVLMGEVLFAPFNRVTFLGVSLPTAFAQLFIVFSIICAFVILFYKELKIASFDSTFAFISGFSVALIHHIFMTLVTATAVIAFDAVGSILVINFFVAPSLSAYLITKRLSHMIVFTSLISIVNTTIGFFLGFILDVSLSGMISFVSFISFMMIFLLRRDGFLRRRKYESN